ncbi:MAG: hypothetical protein BAA01_09125 [Bacillus thermozeamaize]|uniref:Prepilin-type N-terminal cleavage/methylation domain-containing protein n=1 Tax=Bacillus thermozeamaize TaxID=230954 RepID=A0A1Y3PIQ5_9BACI|nr:MAG: hypothetical protein BAA01_09125 [Bacillus thermozeamaize]
MKFSRGFTLVEVLAVTVLVTILLGALYAMVNEGLRNWYHISEQTELRNGANLVMQAIQKDLLKAKRSPDGQEAVSVVDKNELKIVTAWTQPDNSQPAQPTSLVVYTIVEESGKPATIFRYAGPPPSGSALGMQLMVSDLDFSNSSFELQSNGRVLVKLSLKGPRKNDFHTSSSFRYVYGS